MVLPPCLRMSARTRSITSSEWTEEPVTRRRPDPERAPAGDEQDGLARPQQARARGDGTEALEIRGHDQDGDDEGRHRREERVHEGDEPRHPVAAAEQLGGHRGDQDGQEHAGQVHVVGLGRAEGALRGDEVDHHVHRSEEPHPGRDDKPGLAPRAGPQSPLGAGEEPLAHKQEHREGDEVREVGQAPEEQERHDHIAVEQGPCAQSPR
ncbi:hypothetical protein [Dietzia sp. CW19]|uniref:hypothetical protein n=1 Tax=Dietzia sp. CW19 TaxID=1630634 RepID=UPI00321F7BB4